MHPDEFYECNGQAKPVDGVVIGQQKRIPFGFCYRTAVGNDVLNDAFGYKIHIIWGATVSPSSRTYNTINDNPEISTMSWEFTTNPVAVEGYKPTSVITVDSTDCDGAKLTELEDTLYGTSGESGSTGTAASLPSPAKVLEIFTE
jgi:hypothetical protein